MPKKVLVVLPEFFFPLNSGGNLRTYHLLKALANDYDVSIVCPRLDKGMLPSDPLISRLRFIYVISGQGGHSLSLSDYWRRIVNRFWSKNPRMHIFRYQSRLSHALIDAIQQYAFDLIIFEHTFMAVYAPLVKKLSPAKLALTAHNCEWLNFKRILSKQPQTTLQKILGRVQLAAIKRRECSLRKHFDLCVAVSDVEKTIFEKLNPGLTVEVVPNGTDTAFYSPTSNERDTQNILFVGSLGYLANKDGVRFFAKEVMPLIVHPYPDVVFTIVGRGAKEEVRALGGNHINVVGEVDDVRPYLEAATVSVCPLRIGGGTRLKILESFAAGIPVVSTTVGAEGLDVQDGTHLLLADDASRFANAVTTLLGDSSLRSTLANNGLELARNVYDWKILGRRQNQIFNALLSL